MAGWQQRPNGREFKQTLGDGEGQGDVLCCSAWSLEESDRTEQLSKMHFPEIHCLQEQIKSCLPGTLEVEVS